MEEPCRIIAKPEITYTSVKRFKKRKVIIPQKEMKTTLKTFMYDDHSAKEHQEDKKNKTEVTKTRQKLAFHNLCMQQKRNV